MFLLLKIWQFIYEGDQNKHLQSIVLIYYIDYLSDTFNINRGASRTAATSTLEFFVIIVNGFQPLTIIKAVN